MMTTWRAAFRMRAVFRFASTYKRSQSVVLSREHLETLRSKLLENRQQLSADEWLDVRKILMSKYKHINASNVDNIVLSMCTSANQLPIAKDYFKFLQVNGIPPNAAAQGRLLKIYNAVYHARGGTETSLTSDEQNKILDIYESMRQKHDVLDASLCENLIYGLVATEKWYACKELLEMAKLTAIPSVSAYSEIVVKAFIMNEMDYGWRVLKEMLDLQKQPKCEVYIAFLEAIAKRKSTFLQSMEQLFEILQKYEIVITEKVCHRLEVLSRECSTTVAVAKTNMSSMGKCKSCGKYLRNVSITNEEFTELSEVFLQKVLIRNDVFQRSSPEEVDRFKRYVGETSPYDIVIDGLNVAYSTGSKKSPTVQANLLASVVKYFIKRRKHMLILGRQHMNSWPKDTMQFIRKNAAIFLTNNLSQDDPFMLYATLKSGPTADFFSRDLMRSHAFQLGPALKAIFRRWQQEHQYSLLTQTENGRILVKEPARHLMFAHKVENTWHLPLKTEYAANPGETFDMPDSWLCVQLNA